MSSQTHTSHKTRSFQHLSMIVFFVMILFPVLAGCVRIKTTLTVSPDDLVSGHIIAAVQPRTDNDKGPQLNPDLPFSQKITFSPYVSDGYVGEQAIFSGLTFSELPQLAELNKNATGVNLTLRRAGNVVVLEGRVDLTLLTDPTADVELSVSFPGEITSTNGQQINDTAVQWRLKPGIVNIMTAQAHYTDPSTRLFASTALWLAIAALCAAGIVIIMAWINRNRRPQANRK